MANSFEEIKEIKADEKDFPVCFKNIKNPPPQIFYKGNIFVLTKPKKIIAIVGTRKASFQGKRFAYSFAREFARRGLVVVSGMAKGIDTEAHKGALEEGGKTIGILGTGLDNKTIYPKDNLKLSVKIAKNGALVSEYPAGTRGTKFTFPERNRLIAASSEAIVIIESPQKSGALITANYGLKQNKKVFAIPGAPYNKNFRGNNSLIKKGAFLAESPQDILKVLKIKTGPQKLKLDFANPEKRKVAEAIISGKNSTEEIIEETGIPFSRVSVILGEMEMEEIIKNIGGDNFTFIK